MRVLAISHSAVAGPYREKWRLLSKRRGWNLTLVVPERWPEGGAMLEASSASFQGIRQHVLPTRLTGRIGFFSYKGLGALIEREAPELVYCEEEPYSVAAWQAALAARRVGAEFVFFSWENIKRTLKPPLNWVRKRVQSLSAAAVLGSSESVRLYRDWGFSGPAALIPQYGVDTRAFKPGKASRRTFKAAYVGRLVHEKGPDLFARACVAAGLQGVIFGQGPDEKRLRALGGDLEFRGFLPFEKRREIYREFDVLVLPSRGTPKWKEQFGRVIIEAGACGIPTIGSDSGAIPEVVGDGGLIFKEGDLQDLTKHLKLLATKPALRKKLGAAARLRALKYYDERKLAGKLGDFLESLV